MKIPNDLSTEETRLLADILRRFATVEASIKAAEDGATSEAPPTTLPHSPIQRAAIAFDAASDIGAPPAERRRNLEIARRLMMERAERIT